MSILEYANSRLSDLYPTKHKPITQADLDAAYTRNILSVNADAKTSKGISAGYLTGILYLSPANHFTKVNLCKFASDGCKAACLFTAGRGRFYSVTRARVVKTLALLQSPGEFSTALYRSISQLKRKANRLGKIPTVRLNGTSDLDWGRIATINYPDCANVFEVFPDVQFYDYTKDPTRAKVNTVPNYHITFSDSGVNQRAIALQNATTNIATVFLGQLPEFYNGKPVINGDLHDLRFLDPPGVIVGLKAKGRAKINYANSFVKDNRK